MTSDFNYVTRGPWHVYDSVSEDSAAVKYEIDGKRETVTVESHGDLALLRDAISEYLDKAAGR